MRKEPTEPGLAHRRGPCSWRTPRDAQENGGKVHEARRLQVNVERGHHGGHHRHEHLRHGLAPNALEHGHDRQLHLCIVAGLSLLVRGGRLGPGALVHEEGCLFVVLSGGGGGKGERGSSEKGGPWKMGQ